MKKRMKDADRLYTYRSLHKERSKGIYWYDRIWGMLRTVLIGVCSVLICAGGIGFAASKVYDEYLAPADRHKTERVEFEVSSGQSLTRIANRLEEAGLIRSRTVFKYYCDFAGLGQKLQVGTYELSPSMSFTAIAEQLTQGSGQPLVRNITLIPGQTIETFAQKLEKEGVITAAESFLSLCRDGKAFTDFYYISDIMALPTAKSRIYMLEGYLAPDTYEVYTNATDEEIIRKLLSQTSRAFPADDLDRASEMGFTMDQILTLASMIEKEAKADDFAKVSAVFHNRLKKNMSLGSDVTVNYVTGSSTLVLSPEALATNSPYNTYKTKGLPPGPICAPSTAAIQAALHPDETMMAEGYLYFCAKDPRKGELHFSKTQEEHDQAVEIYKPLWIMWDNAQTEE